MITKSGLCVSSYSFCIFLIPSISFFEFPERNAKYVDCLEIKFIAEICFWEIEPNPIIKTTILKNQVSF